MKLTDFLVMLCIAFSMYAWASPVDLAFSVDAFLNGEYYTLLTAIFVHANLIHLAGNMVFLYIFGSNLEEDVGASRTGAVFFTGGVLSFVLSIPFYPESKMVGASAAIFSIMAAMLLVRKPGFSFQFLSPTGPLVIVYLMYNLIAIQKGEAGNIAYVSHIIGFIIGAFFGINWNKKWLESLLYTLVLLAVYIFLYNYLINLQR